MRKGICIACTFLIFVFHFTSQTTIKIDGFFDDWSTTINSYVDDSTDAEGIDLLDFSVCNDNDHLYIRIRLADEIDLTEQSFNPAEVMINIDADNDVSTGFFTNNIGSEYGINFLDKFIFDDTNPNIIDTLSLYDLGIIPLPTITSDEFEIAINRSFFSDTISISIREFIGNDFMPDNGSIFTYIFSDCSTPTNATTDFLKNDPMNIRVMTYNVRSNGLISNNRIDQHRRIFESAGADIIAYQECGNTDYNAVLEFLNTSSTYYPYIYPDLNSGNLTISKYPSIQSWQVTNKIDAALIDLPDSIYSVDILIINGHPPCCGNNQGRQENFDAFIEFIHDAKTMGGVIDLPMNTPIVFSGDMNLVGYSEQYYTIINGTISDTATFGVGGFPDWDNTPLQDQVCSFNEKDMTYTWDDSSPSVGDFPPGRLDFVFFTNSVMSVDKSFIISTEDMSASLLSQNNLLWNDTKIASDHFPVIVDFVLPISTGCNDPGACNYDSLATINDGSCVYSTLSTDTQVHCDTYTWMDGNTYTSSNDTATYTMTNALGCDSTITLDLTINPTTQSSIIVEALDSYTAPSGAVYTVGGLYTDTIQNVVACDSIITIDLSLNFTGIGEANKTPKQLIKIVDVLGREAPFKPNTPLIYVYDDGSIEKVFRVVY